MQHLSEVAHILQAAIDQDADKARAYAELLVTKLYEDGEDWGDYFKRCERGPYRAASAGQGIVS